MREQEQQRQLLRQWQQRRRSQLGLKKRNRQ